MPGVCFEEIRMNFSPKKSKETIAAAVNEAKLKAVAKLESEAGKKFVVLKE